MPDRERDAARASKAKTLTEREGVLCRLSASGLIHYGVKLRQPGWPRSLHSVTRRTSAKDAVEVVHTHQDKGLWRGAGEPCFKGEY